MTCLSQHRQFRWATLTLAILAVSGAGTAVLAADSETPALREVHNRLLSWETKQARGHLEPVFDPNQAPHLVAMGRILEQEGKLDEAANRLTQACELAKGNPSPYLYLGELRLRQERSDAAREAFTRAAELARARLQANGNDGLAHYTLGVALQRQHQYDAAIESLQRARSIRPEDPLVVYQLGATRAFQERWKEATELLSQALEMNPGLAYAYYYRGLSAGKMGRKDLMLNDLERFATLAPGAPDAERARRVSRSASR